MPLDMENYFRVAFEARVSGLDGMNAMVATLKEGEEKAGLFQGKILDLREAINRLGSDGKTFTQVLASLALGGDQYTKVLSQVSDAAQHTLESMAQYHRMSTTPVKDNNVLGQQLVDATFKESVRQLSAAAQEIRLQQQQMLSYRTKVGGTSLATIEELKALAAQSGFNLGGAPLSRVQQSLHEFASEAKELLQEIRKQLPSFQPYDSHLTARPRGNVVIDPTTGGSAPGKKSGGSSVNPGEAPPALSEKQVLRLAEMEAAAEATYNYFTKAALEGGQLANSVVHKFTDLSRGILDNQSRVRLFYERVILKDRELSSMHAALSNETAFQLAQRGVVLPRNMSASQLGASPRQLIGQNNAAVEQAELAALEALNTKEAHGRIAAMRSRVLSKQRFFSPLDVALDTETTIGSGEGGINFNPSTFTRASADSSVYQRTKFYSSALGREIKELFATNIPALRGRSVVGGGRTEADLVSDFYQGMRNLLDARAGSGQPLTVGAHNPGFDFSTVHGSLPRLGLNRFQDFFARNQHRMNLVGTEDPYLHLAALYAEQNPSKALGTFLNRRGQLATTPEEMRFLGGWSNENLLRGLGLNIAPKGTNPVRTGIGGVGISAGHEVVLHSAATDAPLSGVVYKRFAEAYNTAAEALTSGNEVNWDGLAQRISRGKHKTMEGLFRTIRSASIDNNPNVKARIDATAMVAQMLATELRNADIQTKLETIDTAPSLTTSDRSSMAIEALRLERSSMMGGALKASSILTRRGNVEGAQALFNFQRRRAAALDRQAFHRKLLANPINPDDLQADRDQAAQLGADPLNLEYRDRQIEKARAFLTANPQAQAVIDPAAAERLTNQAAYAKMLTPFTQAYGTSPLSSYQSVLATIDQAHADNPQARYAQSMNLLRASKKYYTETNDPATLKEIDAQVGQLRKEEFARRSAMEDAQLKEEAHQRSEALKARLRGSQQRAEEAIAPMTDEQRLAQIRARLGGGGGAGEVAGGSRADTSAELARIRARLFRVGGGSGAGELGDFPFESGDIRARQAKLREQDLLDRAAANQRKTRQQSMEDVDRLMGARTRAADAEEKLGERVVQAQRRAVESDLRKDSETKKRKAADDAKVEMDARGLAISGARAQIRIAESKAKVADLQVEAGSLSSKTDTKSVARLAEIQASITSEKKKEQNIAEAQKLREDKAAVAAEVRKTKTAEAEEKLTQVATDRAKKMIELEEQLAAKKEKNRKSFEDAESKAERKSQQRFGDAGKGGARAEAQVRLDREKFAAQQVGDAERNFARRGETLRDIQDRMSPGFRDRLDRVRQEMGPYPGRASLNRMEHPLVERPQAPQDYSASYERYLSSITRYQDRIDSSHVKLMGAWREEETQLAHLKGVIDKMGTATAEQRALKGEFQGLYDARRQQGQERLDQLRNEHADVVDRAQAQAAKAEQRYGHEYERESDSNVRNLERKYSRRKETLEDYALRTSPRTSDYFERVSDEVRGQLGADPMAETRLRPEVGQIAGKERAYRRYVDQVAAADASLAQKRQKYYEMEKEEIESIAALRIRLNNMAPGAQRGMEEDFLKARVGQSREKIAEARGDLGAAETAATNRARRSRQNYEESAAAGGGGGTSSSGGGALLHLGSLIAQYYALQMIVKSTMLSYVEYAARTEQLRVVTEQMAKTNQLNVQSVLQEVEAVKHLNITTQDAHETVQRMMFAQLDVRKATELARLAQDAAVISNENSSQALEKIVTGVVTGQTRMLHYMGLQVSMQQVVREETERLGRAPTEIEKRQAMLNKVLAEGVKIQGNYDASMLTANKQMTSLTRQWQEAENAIGGRLQPAFMQFIMLLSSSAKYVQDNAESFAALATAITATVAAISAYSVASIVIKAGGMLAGSLNPWLAIPAALAGIGIYRAMNKDQYQGRREASESVSDSIKQESAELEAQHATGAISDADYLVGKKRLQQRQAGVQTGLQTQVGMDLSKEYDSFQRVANAEQAGILNQNPFTRFLPTKIAANYGQFAARFGLGLNSIYNGTVGAAFPSLAVDSSEYRAKEQAYGAISKFGDVKPGQANFEAYARLHLAESGFSKDQIEKDIEQFRAIQKQKAGDEKDPLINLRLIVTQQAIELEDQLGAQVRKYKKSIKEIEEKFLLKTITDPLERIKKEVEKEFEKSDIDEKVDQIQQALDLLNIDQGIVDHYTELGQKLRKNKFTDAQVELLNKYVESLPATGQNVPDADKPTLEKVRGAIERSGLSESQIQEYVAARREQVDIERNNPDVAVYGHLKNNEEFQETRREAMRRSEKYRVDQYNEELRVDEIRQRAKLAGEVYKLEAGPGLDSERMGIAADYSLRIGAAIKIRSELGATREIEKEIRSLIIDQALEQEKLNKKVRDMNLAYEVSTIDARSSVRDAGIRAKAGGSDDDVETQVARFNERIRTNKERYGANKDSDALRRSNLEDEKNLEVGIINTIGQRVQALRQANVEELKLKFERAQRLMEAQAMNGIDREAGINKAYELRLELARKIRDEEMAGARGVHREQEKIRKAEADYKKNVEEAKIDRYIALQNQYKQQLEQSRAVAGKVFDAVMSGHLGNPGDRQKAVRDMLHNVSMSTGRTIFENMTQAIFHKGAMGLELPGQVGKDGKATWFGKLLDGTPFQHRADPNAAKRELLKDPDFAKLFAGDPVLAKMLKDNPDFAVAIKASQLVDKNTLATDDNTKEIEKLTSVLDRILGYLEVAGTHGTAGEVTRMLNEAGVKGVTTSVTPLLPRDAGNLMTVPSGVNKERLEQLMRQTKPIERQATDIQTKISYDLNAAGVKVPPGSNEAKYGPMAEEAAKKYGVNPDLFKALIKSESNFDPKIPNAEGSGALGIAQFTEGTGKDYGLNGKGFDNRTNPEASLDAGAKYMSKLLKKTKGDEAKAIYRYKGVGAGGATQADVDKVLKLRDQYAVGRVSSEAGTGDARFSSGAGEARSTERQATPADPEYWGLPANSGQKPPFTPDGKSIASAQASELLASTEAIRQGMDAKTAAGEGIEIPSGTTTNFGWETGSTEVPSPMGPSIDDLMNLPSKNRAQDWLDLMQPTLGATKSSTSPMEAIHRIGGALGTLPGSGGIVGEIGAAANVASATAGGALNVSDALKKSGLTNPFKSPTSIKGLGSDLALVGAEVGMGIDAYHNIKKGGAQGTLGAIGDIAGMAAMVDPEPISKAVLTAVATVSQMAKMLFGDPRAIRKKQIEDSLKVHQFNQAEVISRTMDISGKDVDFDFMGRARTGASPVGGPAQTIHMNIDTIDSKSFMDHSKSITDAVRTQLTLNHPMTDDIRQISANA